MSDFDFKASALYHGKDGFNCAQAVLKTFQDISGMTNDEIASYSNKGGGRAPDGDCGALFAAKVLLQNPDFDVVLDDAFNKVAGSRECRSIRKEKRLSCGDCVELAARLTGDYVNKHQIA